MKDVECPYCGTGQEINHDDGYGYEEDDPHEQSCPHCDKTFVFYTTILFHYSAHKADCLNGSPHRYEKTKTYPPEFAVMRCIDCRHEKKI